MQASEPIYIFGHTQPDTDSICSAIAYAYLKNTQSAGHIPARLGDLNRETRFVLAAFAVPEPVLLPHVHMRVQDVMTTEVITMSLDATVYEVGALMHQFRVHAMPIIDEEGRARGVVSERQLMRSYVQELHVQSLGARATALGKIVQTLDATVLVGELTTANVGNRIGEDRADA